MWVHIVSFHSLSLAELRARFPAGGVSNVGELNIGYTYRSRRRGEAVGPCVEISGPVKEPSDRQNCQQSYPAASFMVIVALLR